MVRTWIYYCTATIRLVDVKFHFLRDLVRDVSGTCEACHFGIVMGHRMSPTLLLSLSLRVNDLFVFDCGVK